MFDDTVMWATAKHRNALSKLQRFIVGMRKAMNAACIHNVRSKDSIAARRFEVKCSESMQYLLPDRIEVST
jgi:hypothetical protein